MTEKPVLYIGDFIEVLSKAGRAKRTAVAKIKNREEYNVAQDFWKTFRTAVVKIHKNSQPKATLDEVLKKLPDDKKRNNYPAAILGYKKWWGTKKLEWFNPPEATYSESGVDVKISPELGLKVNGIPYVIKLHLKKDKLAKKNADIATSLMALKLVVTNDTRIGVLDVRNAKIFLAEENNDETIIDGELAYIASVWEKV